MKYSSPINAIRDRLSAALGDNELHLQGRAIAAQIARVAGAVESLEQLAKHRDPTETEARHAQRVAAAAEKLKTKTAEVEHSIWEAARVGAGDLEARITNTANLNENGYAAEIRQAVRGMTDQQRTKVLHDAVESGDAATVAALTKGPGVITGLNSEIQQRMLESYREKHAPAEHAALVALMDTVSTAATVIGLVKAAASKAVDPAFINEIQSAQAAAQNAQAGFDGAIL